MTIQEITRLWMEVCRFPKWIPDPMSFYQIAVIFGMLPQTTRMKVPINSELSRKADITDRYFRFLDQHLTDLVTGKTTEMLELNDIARELCISHKHLIAIIRETSGEHPCHFYINKIIKKSQQLLTATALPVAEIARMLTYDPSNFNKFFKKYVGQTPGQYRATQPQAA